MRAANNRELFLQRHEARGDFGEVGFGDLRRGGERVELGAGAGDKGTTTAVAAREADDESTSQFSRKLKRFFGDGPAPEASLLREALTRF